MTGVKWVRLDTNIWANPKVMALVRDQKHRTALVYVFGIAYAGAIGNEGWIPDIALPLIHGRPVDASLLVTAQLWVPAHGGWAIHDWHEYQASNETIAARTKRARVAAEARWQREQ